MEDCVEEAVDEQQNAGDIPESDDSSSSGSFQLATPMATPARYRRAKEIPKNWSLAGMEGTPQRYGRDDVMDLDNELEGLRPPQGCPQSTAEEVEGGEGRNDEEVKGSERQGQVSKTQTPSKERWTGSETPGDGRLACEGTPRTSGPADIEIPKPAQRPLKSGGMNNEQGVADYNKSEGVGFVHEHDYRESEIDSRRTEDTQVTREVSRDNSQLPSGDGLSSYQQRSGDGGSSSLRPHRAPDVPKTRPIGRAYDSRFLALRPAYKTPGRVRRRDESSYYSERHDRHSCMSPSGRDPLTSDDVGSITGPLNEEQVDELWKDLEDGVSQRGATNAAARARANARATQIVSALSSLSAGSGDEKTNSGSYPMLTERNLYQHDMALQISSSSSKVQAVPESKRLSKKGQLPGSNKTSNRYDDLPLHHTQKTTRGIIGGYLLVALCASHLVYNILLTVTVLPDEPLWGLCFIPGFLGLVVNVNGIVCGRNHSGEKSRGGLGSADFTTRNHTWAVLLHLVLLGSIVTALLMHFSALVFCKSDEQIILPPEYAEPVCDVQGVNALLLPIALESIMMVVTSVRAVRLCCKSDVD